MATWATLAGSSNTKIRKTVAEILQHHVTFELEAIDRMYLNAYRSRAFDDAGAPMSQQFVDAIARFAEAEGVDVITFEKGQRKDDALLVGRFERLRHLRGDRKRLGDGDRPLGHSIRERGPVHQFHHQRPDARRRPFDLKKN